VCRPTAVGIILVTSAFIVKYAWVSCIYTIIFVMYE